VHLRSVSAAARIGASLEPFTGERIVTIVDPGDILHFDTACPEIGSGREITLDLAETYRYRQCGRCLRPYRFPDRVERYGIAVEELQRAKFLAREAEEAGGISAMRGVQQVEAACRRAIRIVSAGESSGGAISDIERCAAGIRRIVEGVGHDSKDAYLDWAATGSVDAVRYIGGEAGRDMDRWRGRIEHARGEMRRGGWAAFQAALGVEEESTTAYREAVCRYRESGGGLLLAVKDGVEEGDLILWAAGSAGVVRSGVWYTVVPHWAVAAAAALGADFERIGPVDRQESEVVEIYAELARTRPGSETLLAARRLARGRGRIN